MQIEDRIARLEAAVFPEPTLYREDVEWADLYKPSWLTPSGSWEEYKTFSSRCHFRHKHTKAAITEEQFLQAVRNSDERVVEIFMAEAEPQFRVGDLVEVTADMLPWFRTGERFHVDACFGSYVRRRDRMIIDPDSLRLISRP
jgi:hypothetical protein